MPAEIEVAETTSDGSLPRPSEPLSPTAPNVAPTRHAVRFYEDDAHLVQTVADFIGAGLASGHVGLVIMRDERHRALEQCLEASSIDVHCALDSRELTILDAEELLATFTTDEEPDPDLFRRHIGGLVRAIRSQHGERPLRAFGEMVDILCRRGRPRAAIRLEQLWNELARGEDVTLLCGYWLESFSTVDSTATFDHVCRLHTHVLPSETSEADADGAPHARDREVARLQQRVRALVAEVERREVLVQELREQREKLGRRERELRDFIDQGVMGIHWIGPDGTILLANDAELQMLGYAREEYVGRHIREFHADVDVCEDILQRLHAGETLADYEARLRAKDGTLKHVEIHSNVCWRDGRFLHTRCFTKDISARKGAEEAVRRSQERLDVTLRHLTAVMDQLPSAFAIVEAPSGKVLVANRQCEVLLGTSVQATNVHSDERRYVALHPDGRPFAPEDWPIVRSIVHGAVINGEELHIVRPDGRAVYLRMSTSPIRDDEGTIVAGIAISEDITEQREAARVMQVQNRINSALLSIASWLNSELDLEVLVGRLTEQATALCRAELGAFFFNVAAGAGESYMLYTLAGEDRSRFEGFPMPRKTELFQPTFDGTPVVRLDDVTKDPRFGKTAPHFGMPSGHVPVKSYLAVPVKSRSGEVLGGLFFGHSRAGMFREADERLLTAVSAHAAAAIDNAKLFGAVRRAEETASAERHKLRELFMQSPALIVILRGPDHVYDFVNAGAAPLVGRDDAVGKPLREVLPDLPPERVALLDEVYATGKRYVEDGVRSVRDWKGDGRPYERFFNMVYEPYRHSDGTVAGIMSFGFEVTEQVRAKQKLEAIATELENANRTKDEFLATVSHELRTPLNAILGWARMLRSSSLSPEKQARAIETIERNANAQTLLVEDLLDVSRIISGKLRLDVGNVDLPSVVENAIDAVRPAAHAKGVTLRQTLEPDVGPLLGDAGRLQQVAWNLLTNAVKFTANGGMVTIAVRKRESFVELVVTDDGQGIAPEFLPNVFERFRQADGSPARKQGGLGLGLAIVRHLVELHGGTARVESEGLGRGATFTVSLPVSPVRTVSLERPPPLSMLRAPVEGPVGLEGVHVLVVDDEPDVRELLAEMLQMCNAHVVTAASTAEALQLVQELRPDVIVSDIGMPREDGYVLVQKLRALPQARGGQTPAVALTAFTRFEDRTKALISGFNMHVPKPVEPAELIAVLTSLTRMFPRHQQ